MVRLSKNWNVDLKTLIPYFTMNMLNPSQRKYRETLPGIIANIIDHSPFMKHPIGQVLVDYIILPSILSEADQPPRSIWTTFISDWSNFWTESFLWRTFIGGNSSAWCGKLCGLLQPLVKAVGVPDEAIKYYPSYGGRQIAEATQGKSTVGFNKRGTCQKTLRALLGRSGLPLYPLNTEFLSKQNQKKINIIIKK